MKETFLCVMAQYDAETEMKLADLQRKMTEAGFIGRQSKHLKHHITLGIFDVSQETRIKDRIDEITRDFAPFEIRLGSLGLFRTDVLFISPVANHALHRMHDALHQGIDEDLNWVPHSTMFIEETNQVLQAVEFLAQSFQPFSAKIESIGFYQFQPTRFILEKSLTQYHE
ncbi:MAG: 2'-5' RNA ligase family protein [Erysipelotrichaceae bacterium]